MSKFELSKEVEDLIYEIGGLTPKENEQLGRLFTNNLRWDENVHYLYKQFIQNYLNRQLELRRKILNEKHNFYFYEVEYYKSPN